MSNHGFSPDADNKAAQWWIKYPPKRRNNAFTVTEVMRAFGVARYTVYDWIKAGKIKRIGRGLVSRRSVAAFMATDPKYTAKAAARG